MEHHHSHSHGNHHEINYNQAFKLGIAINVLFIVAESLYGFWSNSMALIADAGHNLSDVLALVFAWVGILLSQRKPTLKFTYGFRRSTILIAILNTVLLLAAVGIMIYETISRMGEVIHINSINIIVIASIGIFVNGFTAWLFMKDNKHDLNIRSAFVHFVADTLVSLGVVIAGVIMYYTGITWIDTLVSFVIIAIILYSSYQLLISSVSLAIDAVPENINISEVKGYFETLREVDSIHDLHIWALSTTDTALTVHLATNEQTDFSFISKIQHELHNKFEIRHATIQVEYGYGKHACHSVCK
jgi:cobalt-zinc-cadmium efflux system protein